MLLSKWRIRAGWLGVLGVAALASSALRAEDAPSREGDERPRAEGRGRREPGADAGRAARARGAQYWLGIECFPAPGLLREQLNLPEGQGLVVEATAPEGPAAEAGIKKHDILLSADGKSIDGVNQLLDVVQAADGKAIEFKLLRAGKETTVSVTPAKGGGPPVGRDHPGREPMERAWQQIREAQEQALRATDPIRMRFFHPGMVLPPGMGFQPPLPDGMRVTVTREGKKPAEIQVKQGDETWQGTEDELDKMPEKFRPPVDAMLGRFPGIARPHGDFPGPPGEMAERLRSRAAGPGPAAGRVPGREPNDAGGRGRRGVPDGNLDERMRELSRQVDRIREEIDALRERRGGEGAGERAPNDRQPAPPARPADAPEKP